MFMIMLCLGIAGIAICLCAAFEKYAPVIFILSFIFVFVLVVGNGNSFCVDDTKECQASVKKFHEQQERQRLEHKRIDDPWCKEGMLISEIDGVSLYRTNCPINNGEYVYFSKLGTTTSHEDCHSNGKSQSCDTITDTVSGGN